MRITITHYDYHDNWPDQIHYIGISYTAHIFQYLAKLITGNLKWSHNMITDCTCLIICLLFKHMMMYSKPYVYNRIQWQIQTTSNIKQIGTCIPIFMTSSMHALEV